MCNTCAQIRPFDANCIFQSDDPVLMQDVYETGDASASTNTAESMSVGDTFYGDLYYAGDRDLVRIDLVAGQYYEISITGQTLADPYLRVYDSNGRLVDSNDDISLGVNVDSRLTFLAGETGSYYISAGSYDDSYTGTYSMSAVLSDYNPGAPYTPEQIATYLTTGFWGGTPQYFGDGGAEIIAYDISGLTSDGQRLALYAMEAWSLVANLTFVDAGSGTVDLLFRDDLQNAYSTSQTVSRSGYNEITSSMVNVSTDWLDAFGTTLDSYSFQTYIHEIGHAIGLGHAGDYNGSATYGQDNDYSNDSWQATVMSYFSQSDNTAIQASHASVITPMLSDIIAVNSTYGAPTRTNGGATTYGYNSTATGYMSTLLGIYLGETASDPTLYDDADITFTIYDSDGTDTLDLSGVSAGLGQRVDLMPGSISDVFGLIGNVTISRDTTIENVIMGDGADSVRGNTAANFIHGAGGNDTIEGGLGDDIVSAGHGRDAVLGGAGDDTVSGHGDGDLIAGDGGADSLSGGLGNDTIMGGVGNDTLLGQGGNDTLRGQSGADSIQGHIGDDYLIGDGGNDTLEGGAGHDLIDGGTGTDFLSGSGGNDAISGGGGNDSILGGGGNDTIDGGAGSDTIYGGAGRDEILGGGGADYIEGELGGDNLRGGGVDDTILGGAHNDWLRGEGGNDFLSGGTGDDRLSGGAGADAFVFALGDGNDRIADFADNLDALHFNSNLWSGSMSAAQVVDTFARLDGSGNTIFDFENGVSVLVIGIADQNLLSDDIIIF
ncbi:MAG: M10 family metallopeptidase C-terminal domain-containing protein [Paracoccaceae bacterium]